MNKLIRAAGLLVSTGIVFLAFATPVFAAGAGAELLKADINPGMVNSLQRGARNYMNFCSGCHSAQYVRFNTIGKDLELSDEQLVDNLMFNAEKTYEPIVAAMSATDGERWYGNAPPDLSLMARAKGADYIYSFLMGFYLQEGSPTGVDNLYLPGTSMPHVLWRLQGYQRANFSEHTEDGVTTKHFEGFEQVTEGQISPAIAVDYEEFVRDTVNFLAYIAEPIRADRRKIGTWVIMYLLVFLIIAYMLKKQVWKDVH